MEDPPRNPPPDDPNQETLAPPRHDDAPGISSLNATRPGPAPPPARQSTFAPGDTVAKRFRILRFIAQGGMGEVYEALDIELKQKVALKTVRAAFMTDAKALERFRQEIVVAKRVTHPNVCRTFDLFRHEATPPNTEDVLVISMEFLSGTTLDHLLREKGKLSTAEAFPLLQQMILGLAAAHKAGVVHRDFKTNNVMLVSDAGATRVVVSDFGLAHSLDSGEFALTGTGEMLGTPAYMAPEQITGKEITPSTDIYSLGVVLFEMVTGRLPFEGKNWREVAFQRLEAAPPVPKSLVPALDEKWSRAILKCLEREPADRFGTVQEVESALLGETQLHLREEFLSRQKRRRALLASIGLLLIAAIGVAIGIKFPNLFPWRKAPSVTVLGFKNVTGDKSYDPWGDQFRRRLRTDLDVKAINYKTLSGMDNTWKPPSPSEMPEEPEPKLLEKVHRYGCRYVIYGTYQVEGAPPARIIIWDIHIEDLDTKQSQSIHHQLLETERETAASDAATEVRETLGAGPGEKTPEKISNQAAEAAGLGQRKMENFDYLGAREEFDKALKLAPQDADIRSDLAEALWNLGYEQQAAEESNAAAELAKSWSSDKKHRILLRQLQYNKHWDEAADLYGSLSRLQPDNFSYLLEQAKNQMEANHLPEAVATLKKPHGKTPSLGVQAQGELLLTQIYERSGDNQARLQAALDAATKAKAIPSPLLEARAETAHCLVLMDLGKMSEATSVCQDALRLSEQAGNPSDTARAKNAIANGLLSHGETDQAEHLYEEARATTHAIGDKRNEAGALFNLGAIQYNKQNYSKAREWWQQSLAVSIERGGVNDDLLDAQAALADLARILGDPRQQITVLLTLENETKQVGDNSRRAVALGNLCETLLLTGDLASAKSNCDEAARLRQSMQGRSGQARSLTDLADWYLASDDAPQAAKNYQAALAIQKEIDEKSSIPATERGLAEILIEQGTYPEALALLNSALPQFVASNSADDEAVTRSDLSTLYLKTAQLKLAQEQIAKASALAANSSDPTVHSQVQVQQARVQAKTGQAANAAVLMKSLEAELRKAGYLQLALEAKLARAESLAGAPRKAELKSIAEESKEHGYALLARKAAEAAAR